SPFRSGPGLDRWYDCRHTRPSLQISTSIRVDRALTTEMPTPCRPPETWYALPSNLPPACRTVSATSTPGRLSLGWRSTGMPRPLSVTRTPPSASSVTSMVSQKPANASSTALSTTSQTRWCRPRSPVEPMYMAGRIRTASRPSRTVSEPAVYCYWLGVDPATPSSFLRAGARTCRGRPHHPGAAAGRTGLVAGHSGDQDVRKQLTAILLCGGDLAGARTPVEPPDIAAAGPAGGV